MASVPSWSDPVRPPPRAGSAPALSPAEFGRHFHDCFRSLWLVAMGITHDPAMAEDVVQDAAVIALGKLEHFDANSNFAAWMSQMVRFVGYNTARREHKRKASSVDPVDLDRGVDHSPVAGVPWSIASADQLGKDQEWFDDSLVAALSSVAPAARACLLLRTLGGLEYAEISRLLDIPEGTAMSHVHRTRKQLRERIGAERQEASRPRGNA